MFKPHSLGHFLNHLRAILFSSGLLVSLGVLILLGLPLRQLSAAELKEAHVTQVIKDVKLLPGQAAPRPANVSDEVRNGTAVRTGLESRAELTFTDQTLARLGANTIFSFNEGTRNLQLGGGAMLLRVPKNSGGARINTAAITAAITGTTIMLEYHPDAYIKFIVLEGTGRIFRNDRLGESVLVHAGQMLIVNPKGTTLPDPVDVDLNQLIKTSLLINGFRPLPSDDLIAHEIQSQTEEKSDGELVQTNLVIFGGGTIVSLLDPTHSNVLDQANANDVRNSPSPSVPPTITPTPTVTVTATPTVTVTATPTVTVTATPTVTVTATPTVTVTATPTITVTPTPTPGKFGALVTITSPNPYVINNGTVINTDPRITTNGQTDFGKIYRGPTDDGTPSVYLFGSTNSFDTQSGFDSHFSDPSNAPLAAFKFSALELAGNPTISIANGGATNLALISVGDITSGTADATLTFAGINSLLLATQNGSITLGDNLTFQNIPTLFVYARGIGSTLTFDAAVTGTTNLALFSEANIQVTDNLTVAQTSPTGFTDGIFDTIIAGQSIDVGGDLVLSIDTSGTNNDSGINVAADSGSLTIGGLLDLSITATSGTISNGANLNLSTGTDLNAGSLALTLNLASAQTTVTNGANIVINAGGDLTITNDATINLLHNSGGNISNGGNIFVTTGGGFTAGSLTVLLNNRDGGKITDRGYLVFDIGGALTTTGDASLVISGRDDGGGGGTFGARADISLSAGSISIGGLFNVGTGLSAGGTAGEVLNNIFSTGAVTTDGGLVFNIQNGGGNINDMNTGGGVITHDAALSLTAASVSTGDVLHFFVNNLDGGTIGGDATVGFAAVGGAVTAETDATFEIISGNNPGVTSLSSIGSDAAINFSSGSFSAGSLLTQIFNQDGSSIGGDADISFNVAGALDTSGNATFRIVNSDDGQGLGGGNIDGDAAINVKAATLSAANLIGRINNLGGAIGGNADVTFGITGALTTTGDATFEILDFGPTQLDLPIAGEPNVNGSQGSFNINVSAGSFNIAGSLIARISDQEVSFDVGNVTVSATNGITVGNQVLVDGTVTAGGNISATNGIVITGGSLMAGGNITSSAGDITQNPSDDGEIGIISAGGNISAAGVLGAFYFDTSIEAGGSITASDVGAVTLQAGGNITIGQATGSPHFVSVDSVTAGGAIKLINVGDIQTITSTATGGIGYTPDPFSLSARSLSSMGPAIPALFFDGEAPDPSLGNDNPGNGGNVTLNLTAAGLTIGSAGDITSIDASGGDFATDSKAGGDGGTVDISATGDVSLVDGDVVATTGLIPVGSPAPMTAGDGGAVAITAGGEINVDSTIQVSSDDATETPAPVRRSSTGGNINLTSNKAAGVAINVSNSGQLLALLDAAAPGPGGTITILATGTNSQVNMQGNVQANRGTIDIQHTGSSGQVQVAGLNSDFPATLHADVVKVGALGSNGTLTVGDAFINADTVLKLYAPGSNGELNFIANATLSSGTSTILAANKVTIQPSIVVNIAGAGGPAQVYTNNPNYSGFGGTNPNNGTFVGNGAASPAPLASAPPFGGTGSAHH